MSQHQFFQPEREDRENTVARAPHFAGFINIKQSYRNANSFMDARLAFGAAEDDQRWDHGPNPPMAWGDEQAGNCTKQNL